MNIEYTNHCKQNANLKYFFEKKIVIRHLAGKNNSFLISILNSIWLNSNAWLQIHM